MTSQLKLALRVLLRRPAFTAVSLFTIAATLLVVSVAASLLDEVFGHRGVEARLENAVGVLTLGMYGEQGGLTAGAGYGFLDQHMRDLPGVADSTFFAFVDGVSSYVDGQRVRLMIKRADGGFWRVFRLKFLEGAPFTDDDERDRNFVAVINAAMRDRLLGGGPAVGRFVDIDGQRFRVVGVVDNVPIVKLLPAADVWVPISTSRNDSYKHEDVGTFQAVFVPTSAAEVPALRAEIARRIATTEPLDLKRYSEIRGGADTKFEAVSRMLFADRLSSSQPGRLRTLLVAFALLFMLLPAVNLTNLNLSRFGERASEIGVRRAFGAPRRSLVGQFLLENLILTLIGGLIGFAASALALAAINASGVVAYAEFGLSFAVLGWTLAASALFGILSGVWPAYRMSRLAPVVALSGGPR